MEKSENREFQNILEIYSYKVNLISNRLLNEIERFSSEEKNDDEKMRLLIKQALILIKDYTLCLDNNRMKASCILLRVIIEIFMDILCLSKIPKYSLCMDYKLLTEKQRYWKFLKESRNESDINFVKSEKFLNESKKLGTRLGELKKRGGYTLTFNDKVKRLQIKSDSPVETFPLLYHDLSNHIHNNLISISEDSFPKEMLKFYLLNILNIMIEIMQLYPLIKIEHKLSVEIIYDCSIVKDIVNR